MADEKTKETQATSYFEIWVDCPYCGESQIRTNDLAPSLDENELRAEKCYAELECKKCGKEFIVNEIQY